MPEDAGSIYSSVYLKLDELQRGIISVGQKLDQMSNNAKSKASGFAGFWKNAFQTAFGMGITQIINRLFGVMRDAMNVFTGFQQSMKNTQSVTNAVGEEFRLLSEKAKEAGEATRFTASQAADALYFLGSAGFSAKQSIDALDGVLQLAGATQSDLASTAETVAATISQYGLAASDASRISNVFAAACANSQATMEKLTNSFRQVGPIAAGMGLSLEKTTGILQGLYNAGFVGETAGRALKSALADLASPTASLRQVFDRLGISLEKVNPTTNDFADIMDVLKNSGMETSDIIDAFGKIAGPQMAVLIKNGGDAIRDYTDAVTGTQAAAKAYAIQNDSLAGSMDFLKSKLEGVAISIFEKLEPGMREAIDSFVTFLESAKPLGQFLGNIINLFFKLATVPINILSKVFNVLLIAFRDAKTPMEEAGDRLEKVTDAIKRAGELGSTAKRLTELTNEYEKLKSKTNLTESEQDRLRSVITQIQKIMPEAITKFDAYGNAIEVSGEKSREAARQLLVAREATISAALTELKMSEAIYQRTIRENQAKADAAKAERNRLISQSTMAEARLATLEKFINVYEMQLEKSESANEAYNKTIAVMDSELQKVGLSYQKQVSSVYEAQIQYQKINSEMEKSSKTLNDLQKSISKPAESEQLVEDAKKKLKEITDLQKELSDLQKSLTDIEKVDPVDPNAVEKINTLSEIAKEFWKNYKYNLEKATMESKTFGEQTDVLKARLDFLKSAYMELLDKGLLPTSDTMQKIRQEYDLTLAELNALTESEKNRIAEEERQKQISNDIEKMTADYYQKIQELGKSENELIEIERNRALESVYASGASAEAIAKAIEAINLYYDKLKANSEETKEQFKINIDEILSSAQELSNALLDLWAAQTDNRLEELDRQMQAELEAAGVAEETERERLEKELEEAKKSGNKERIQEAKDNLKRLDIQEKYEQKAAMIKYKAADLEWKFSLAQAIVSTAQAVAKAVASAAWPLNIPAIAFATAIGGLQIAAVNAQKPEPPKFDTGGLFLDAKRQYTGADGGTPAILHNREMVLNEGQMKTLFDAINTGKILEGKKTSNPISISVELDGYTIGKIVEDMANGGQITFKPERALRK